MDFGGAHLKWVPLFVKTDKSHDPEDIDFLCSGAEVAEGHFRPHQLKEFGMWHFDHSRPREAGWGMAEEKL